MPVWNNVLGVTLRNSNRGLAFKGLVGRGETGFCGDALSGLSSIKNRTGEYPPRFSA